MRPGERIPIDGMVVEGRSAIEEAMLTGESLPVDKQPGAQVYAAVTERRLVAVARESEAAMIGEFASNACACIGEAVDRLGPNYRHAIHRVHAEGVPLDAYAREAGITRGNAAVRLHRARKALHAEVKACCGGCADAGCRDCTCGTSS